MGIENECGDHKISLKKNFGCTSAPISLSMILKLHQISSKFVPYNTKKLHFLHLYIQLQEIGANKVPDIKINGQALKCTNV